jgi:hypothetical protein
VCITIVAALLHAYQHLEIGTKWLTTPVADLFGRDAGVLLARLMKGSRPEVVLGLRIVAIGCAAWVAARAAWIVVLACTCRLTLERALPTTPLVHYLFGCMRGDQPKPGDTAKEAA